MNNTPRASRTHIAIFGMRNVGKSSVINALTNQQISLVSDFAGTTTDPVFKSMEILPLGPVVLIDTAGIDDVGELGELRVQRTYDVINKTDIGLIVFDVNQDSFKYEFDLIKEFKKRQFRRSYQLPNSIDRSAINANHENGILQITLPKSKEEINKVRTIEIG